MHNPLTIFKASLKRVVRRKAIERQKEERAESM